jgi:hypothetical protein
VERREPQAELAEVGRRVRGGKRESIALTCDLDAAGVQGKALVRSRLVRVGLRSLHPTENAAVRHRKHPYTLVPALRSNTAFGISDGLNPFVPPPSFQSTKDYLSSYRLTISGHFHRPPIVPEAPMRRLGVTQQSVLALSTNSRRAILTYPGQRSYQYRASPLHPESGREGGGSGSGERFIML